MPQALNPKEIFHNIQSYCLAKEEAIEDYPWGDTVWKVGGKLFAGSRAEHATVTVKATLDEQAVLVQHPDIEIAHYVGRFGWVTINIKDEETLALARHLIDGSYSAVRPKRKRRPA